MNPNLRAFLDMIAVSEIGPALLAASDNGYNVLVGGSLFYGYADHPRVNVPLPRLGISSTAAGRYQILARYFDVYKKQLGLPDFGHDSQDAIAVQLIRECDALSMVVGGAIAGAVQACSSRWASLPGATYGQHTNQLPQLLAAFTAAGGDVA